MRPYQETQDSATPADARPSLEDCNCLAVRQAARHVTQFYDQFLAPVGLRTTQLSILARLQRLGPMTIKALARGLVMDRTTLGRNILPLQREGLVAVVPGRSDRRSRELQLTKAGVARVRAAVKRWAEAQTRFEARFGVRRTAELRALLRAVSATELETDAGRAGTEPASSGTAPSARPGVAIS
jgi:DNA-binding MarR family transcriptional regulator